MALIKCTECSNEVSDKAKICPKCGAPIITLIRCGECSNEISNNAKSCPKCGAPVHSHTQQGVVSIPAKEVNNTFIWLLAFTPIIGEVIKLILLNNGYNLGNNNTFSSLIFYFILNSILVTLDDRQVKKAGYETDTFVSIFWGFLLIPVYFWRRASMTKQSKSYFWVWIVSLIISAFISSAYSKGFKVEDARKTELEDQLQKSADSAANALLKQADEAANEEKNNTTEDNTLETNPNATKIKSGEQSILIGTIKYKLFYGSPGFGENPETDTKEYTFILELDNPILFYDDEFGDDPKWENVNQIHILDIKNKFNLEIFKDKKIKIKCSLFHSHTGHHHAPAVTNEIFSIENILRNSQTVLPEKCVPTYREAGEKINLITDLKPYKFLIDSNNKFMLIQDEKLLLKGNLTQKDFSVTRNYALILNNCLFIFYEISNVETGNSLVTCINMNQQKILWTVHLSGFNLGQPIINNEYAYVTTQGNIEKIDTQTGNIIWAHDDLYKNGHFNSFETPVILDGKIIFKTDKDEKIIIEDDTGTIIETKY